MIVNIYNRQCVCRIKRSHPLNFLIVSRLYVKHCLDFCCGLLNNSSINAKAVLDVVLPICDTWKTTQWVFGAKMTSYRRRCGVILRRIGVNTTSFLRHVPAG